MHEPRVTEVELLKYQNNLGQDRWLVRDISTGWRYQQWFRSKKRAEKALAARRRVLRRYADKELYRSPEEP